MIDAVGFIERYPVFQGINEQIIEDELLINYDLFKEWQEPYQDKAVALITAHVLRLEHGDNLKLGGGLRALEEGKEVKVDLVDLSLPYYEQTIYGQQFLRLRKQVKTLSMFVV